MAFPVTSIKQRTVRYGVIDDLHPEPHTGDDFGWFVGGVKYPLDCFAITDGRIESGYNNRAGNFINIYKGNERFLYGHLAKILTKSGNVPEGLKIAIMGETGYASGVHLHFGYYVNDVQADPAIAYAKYVTMKPMVTEAIVKVLIKHYWGREATKGELKAYAGKLTPDQLRDRLLKDQTYTDRKTAAQNGNLEPVDHLPTGIKEVYKDNNIQYVEVKETLYRRK